MNELHLFAGAGGGILGGQLLGHRCVCAVEREPYAQAVLVARQNDGTFPPFPIWDDVCTFDGKPWRGIADVVCGGFPCQAYSSAAAGKNIADDLWPEMRRVVADVAPRYVFAENVQKSAIDRAGEELEEMGYETKAISLGAHDLGSDHLRERFWLFAYADCNRELRKSINAEMAVMQSVGSSFWKSNPRISRISDGVAYRTHRLKSSGNGQVPVVAATAFAVLSGKY